MLITILMYFFLPFFALGLPFAGCFNMYADLQYALTHVTTTLSSLIDGSTRSLWREFSNDMHATVEGYI